MLMFHGAPVALPTQAPGVKTMLSIHDRFARGETSERTIIDADAETVFDTATDDRLLVDPDAAESESGSSSIEPGSPGSSVIDPSLEDEEILEDEEPPLEKTWTPQRKGAAIFAVGALAAIPVAAWGGKQIGWFAGTAMGVGVAAVGYAFGRAAAQRSE